MLEFKKGIWIKNVDGNVYKIENICDCEQCKKRGFCEPVLSNGDYITAYEHDNGFKGWVATSWNVKDLVDHPLTFQYTNWQGHFNTRSVDGNTARIYYGRDEWHKEDQWLMEALDLDKGELRHFAMKDILNIC